MVCNKFSNDYLVYHGYILRQYMTATLICANSLIILDHYLTQIIRYPPGARNSMADATSHLCHLTGTYLLTNFNTTFPQAKLWRTPPLLNFTSHWITTIMCANIWHRGCQIPAFVRKKPPR